MNNREIIFIKAGGSIFSNSLENIFDIEKAKKFQSVLNKFTNSYKFIITLGGGFMMRYYRDHLAKHNFSNRDLDWVGLSVNNLNAMVMRAVFGESAEERVVVFDQVQNSEKLRFNSDFLFVGGEKPGQSGDTVAVNSALNAGGKTIISIKDVDGVYNADPNKNNDAKLFNSMTWDEYGKMFSVEDIKPGGNYPIDPVAANICKGNNMKFIVMGADDNFKELENYLGVREFKGTIVQ